MDVRRDAAHSWAPQAAGDLLATCCHVTHPFAPQPAFAPDRAAAPAPDPREEAALRSRAACRSDPCEGSPGAGNRRRETPAAREQGPGAVYAAVTLLCARRDLPRHPAPQAPVTPAQRAPVRHGHTRRAGGEARPPLPEQRGTDAKPCRPRQRRAALAGGGAALPGGRDGAGPHPPPLGQEPCCSVPRPRTWERSPEPGPLQVGCPPPPPPRQGRAPARSVTLLRAGVPPQVPAGAAQGQGAAGDRQS